jgi:exopolyphosphatase/guanosine-5'-triphosphate,3'-diphosphate pyrophosphatase
MPTFGAVDIGSNSVRLKVAQLVRSRLELLHEDREVTRLGEGVFRNGALSPEAMEHTIRVLRRFHKVAQSLAVDRVRVVATSATREARNATAFRDWVHSATGWELEVISGLEEGRLIHLGVVAGMRMRASSLLLIDVGGGSCELTRSRDGHIEHMISLPLGAIRLTQEFLQHDPPKRKELARMRQFIAEEIGRAEHRFDGSGIEVTLATSGTAAALAAYYGTRFPRARTVPTPSLVSMAAKLARLTAKQRRALPGIGLKRAEIIVAGANVFGMLLSRLRLPSMRYSPLGLRDGLLAQMAADYSQSRQFRERIATERFDALRGLCRRYAVDVRHAERVRGLADTLFAKLRGLHELPPEYQEWIGAAAMLHEVGAYINRSGRHRHAHYIISHSEIFGYTVAQRGTIATIARYLGGSRPSLDDREMRVVPAGERNNIAPAVALLRVARALDQSRRGRISGVAARLRNGKVHLAFRHRGSIELELWALNKERAYFRDVLGVELVLAAS